jgi:hypothetical protein
MQNQHGRDRFSGGVVEIYSAILWGMPLNFGWLYSDHIDPFLETVLNLVRDGKSCVIRGMTSSDGTQTANAVVGNRRAQFVKSWLIRHGADWRRLSAPDGPIIQPDDNDQPDHMWRGVRIKVSPPGAWFEPDGPGVDS